MTVVLDQKDIATIDKKFAADSQVWQVLDGGTKSITAEDFIGNKTVRINKLDGFIDPTRYVRGGENVRKNINVAKEDIQLTQEDWFGYDLDRLDESENSAYQIQNVVEEHQRLITIPHRDKYAVTVLHNNAGKVVTDTIDSKNALAAYDDAEQYMIDNEIPGGFVMFVSSAFYKALKNADGVTKSFTTNQQQLNGIDRRVSMIDGSIPILTVSKDRLSGINLSDQINFILTPLMAAAPIVKYNTIDYIPADTDHSGYRDTIKGLSYYDVIVFENAKPSIYMSVNGPTKAAGK